jgi:hypothetical protein
MIDFFHSSVYSQDSEFQHMSEFPSFLMLNTFLLHEYTPHFVYRLSISGHWVASTIGYFVNNASM